MMTAEDSQQDAEMNFDQAEFDENAPQLSPSPSCESCSMALGQDYFSVDGTPICQNCKLELEHSLGSAGGGVRLMLAVVGGGIGGIISFVAYYAIGAITGLEVGLVAIVVGLVVGHGVRMGANSRGGWVYQSLAMFLTYIAISLSNLPDILSAAGGTSDPVLVGLLILKLPVYIGLDSPFYGLIVGYAIFDAWRINKRCRLKIEGPFQQGAEPMSEVISS